MEYNEIDLLVLRSVDKVTTQKTIAQEIGCSLGKVNFVLQALIERGLIKAEKFANNQNKKQYKYLLTKEGLKEKVALTEKFIEKKKKEYDMLQADLQMYKQNGEYVKAKGNV